MGCSSCQGRSNTAWEVTVPGRTKVTVDTVAEALKVMSDAGNPKGSSYRAVPR